MPLSAIRVVALLASVFFTSGTQAQSSAGGAQKPAPMMFFPITWSALAEPIYLVKGADGVYHLSYEFKLSKIVSAARSLSIASTGMMFFDLTYRRQRLDQWQRHEPRHSLNRKGSARKHPKYLI